MEETKEQLNISEESSTQLNPLVYWAQTQNQVTLKVEISVDENRKSLFVNFSPKSLIFAARGYGAGGFNNYHFDLNFFGYIKSDECSYRISGNHLNIYVQKVEPAWWPRLVATPQKPHWLKIDFDRWRTEDDALEEEEKRRDVMLDYTKQYERLQKEEFGYIKESTKKVYMVFYNLAQFIGFLYILCVLGVLYYRDGVGAIPKAYESVGKAFQFCQLLQYLEVLHPVFGYVKGSMIMPFFQVSARNFVLFIMIVLEERMQTKPVVFYLFIIWASIEIVRYPYYISQILNRELGLLTWLRYTIWIPLYPLGIVCEGICILRNIPYFEETKRLSVELPNVSNFAFDMATFLKFYLLMLILPGSYLVMSHMAKMRAKKLGTKKKSFRRKD